MSLATKFALEIEKAIDGLAADEWATAKARASILQSITPQEAFKGVVDVLVYSSSQNDEHVFVESCWFVYALAEMSQTTERPPGLDEALGAATGMACRFGCERELAPVRKWYRYGT